LLWFTMLTPSLKDNNKSEISSYTTALKFLLQHAALHPSDVITCDIMHLPPMHSSTLL
jgi:hypothetical protein